MESININEISKFQSSKIVKKIPILSDQIMSTVFFIDTEMTTPGHQHAGFEEIHYIIKGSGKMFIDPESQEVHEGMLILVPKKKMHYFITNGDQLTVLAINMVPHSRKGEKKVKNITGVKLKVKS